MNYWRDGGRLENLQRDGWTLMGNCWGDLNPITRDRRYYHLTVTLTPEGISGQKCTCSDFRGRRLCKHLVALLLAWVHEPQRFKVVSEKKERRPIKRQVPRRVERQHVFLVDFGVAKVMEEVDPKRPRSSSIVAWTDGYSPPEQYASGVKLMPAADQYALAATMVFALTGKTPDDAFTRMEKFRKGEPTLPPKPDGVPESVWKAIEVAMRFEPSQRFADVDEFLEAGKQFMVGANFPLNLQKRKLSQVEHWDNSQAQFWSQLEVQFGGQFWGDLGCNLGRKIRTQFFSVQFLWQFCNCGHNHECNFRRNFRTIYWAILGGIVFCNLGTILAGAIFGGQF